MINSKSKLTKYIRSQLGEPVITVEVTDEQISEIIDDTVYRFTQVAYGDYEDQLILEDKHLDCHRRIRLTRFSNILQVLSVDGKNEFTYHWDSIRRVLTLMDERSVERYLIVGNAAYEQNDEDDFVFSQEWVRKFAMAKTKQLWGNIVGKYSQSIVGGATINYDRLISEAEAEIERLLEELNEKWTDPAPVMIA